MSRPYTPTRPAVASGVLGPPGFRVAVGWRPVNACPSCGGPCGPAAPRLDPAPVGWRLDVVAVCPACGPVNVDVWAARVGDEPEQVVVAEVAAAVTSAGMPTAHCVVTVHCSACGPVPVEAVAAETPGLAVHRIHAHGRTARPLDGAWVVAHRQSGVAVGDAWASAEDAHAFAALLGSMPGAPDWRADFAVLDTPHVRQFVGRVKAAAPPKPKTKETRE